MNAFNRFVHACEGRRVTPGLAVAGLASGAGAGGAMTAAVVMYMILADSGPPAFGPALVVSAFAFVIATAIWLIGLIVVGAPVWWTAHRLRLRCWSAAMVEGAVLAPLGSLALGEWHWGFAGALCVGGALVGLIVWLVAYRKPVGAEGAVCA